MSTNQIQNNEKKYWKIKEIGQGAYAWVYLVENTENNQKYAMKKVDLVKQSKKETESTLNEIRILCSFENSYICGYEEAFLSEDSKSLFIIMEFMGGGDLHSKLKQCQQKKMYFKEEVIWTYFIQILAGLKALHEKKIIHRDIKAANIFLTEDFKVAKLGDLGIAKHAKEDLAKTQIGTPYYLAPEIWDNQQYDYKCDIFSLGVVLYEMATLSLPFNGLNIQELKKSVRQGKYKPIPKEYSIELQELIKSLLRIQPELRPSAEEIFDTQIIQDKIYSLNILKENKINIKQKDLLQTIIMPKNIKQLNEHLPKKVASQRKSSSAQDLQNQIQQLNLNTQEGLWKSKIRSYQEFIENTQKKRVVFAKPSIQPSNA